jgi:hypothetical protein
MTATTNPPFVRADARPVRPGFRVLPPVWREVVGSGGETGARVEQCPPGVGDAWAEWFARLDGLAGLEDGWNSYSAPAPSRAAIERARAFLTEMRGQNTAPTRIAPSVMGGVGITCRQARRKVYVEFYNDGTAHALFSSGPAGMHTRPVPADANDVRAFLAEVRNYLHG